MLSNTNSKNTKLQLMANIKAIKSRIQEYPKMKQMKVQPVIEYFPALTTTHEKVAKPNTTTIWFGESAELSTVKKSRLVSMKSAPIIQRLPQIRRKGLIIHNSHTAIFLKRKRVAILGQLHFKETVLSRLLIQKTQRQELECRLFKIRQQLSELISNLSIYGWHLIKAHQMGYNKLSPPVGMFSNNFDFETEVEQFQFAKQYLKLVDEKRLIIAKLAVCNHTVHGL